MDKFLIFIGGIAIGFLLHDYVRYLRMQDVPEFLRAR